MLTTLKRIVQEVNQIPQLDKALYRLAHRVKGTLSVDSCSIYLADYEQQEFVLKATDGLHPDAVERVRIGFSEGLIGLVGQREEPLNIENAHRHPRFKHYPEVKEEKYNAFLGAPIIHQRKVLGVITMQQSEMRRFSEDEEAFLVTLAAQIALEITNAEIRGALNTGAAIDATPRQKNVRGIAGSPGLAVGVGFSSDTKIDLRTWVVKRSDRSQEEIQVYRKSVEITRGQVDALSQRLDDGIPDDVKSIFQLYHHLLDANSLGREVEAKIREGWDASSSLKMVVEDYAAKFQSMDDPYMQERAIDIVDLSNRILTNILIEGKGHTLTTRQAEQDSILVAEEVSATMLAEFPRQYLKGIISIRGSNNSHAAILARAMGVPAVMGCQNVSPGLLDGKEILLDGYSGEVIVSPERSIRSEFIQLIAEEGTLSERIDAEAEEPCETQDGCGIELYINAGLSAEIEINASSQGVGIGLYRTEIPFMLRERFPSEHEQVDLYRRILQSSPSQPITMRTLDVGGDKPLPYFPINEENPFLGWRGVRLTLDHPEIFLVQVRAMLRASIGLTNLQILLPMISSVNEVKEAKRLIEQAFYEINDEVKSTGEQLNKPKLGIMLEVPSVLYQLPQLAQQVDFFSVGSNDLTQYLLAVDRNNTRVASLYNCYHPAVLCALQDIVRQSDAHKIPVTVCGEIAGEPGGAILLMGMGYRRLSMNAYNLRKINWVIRNVSMAESRELLASTLTAHTHEQVYVHLNHYLERKGLGGLIRAGS
ncbi:phosphoenolpyruvate-protein phosphotransferase PtsP [Alteromonas aestuariivivens]|uniref:phosphoenolpyruvate--protein phosphotransferase n=1 Tax=Alteromonas aestuariivivens TaxID=1938339 RepID=A0A3D8MBR4_9ALTE|nr:phosphoenolpyruvate--protein phosphotransferase [Alteromonas aestuariivivens]RDV27954.1 phosphoenolpyruvate-protein phosphotransferase PtsP [Alteromonas aestuariivivens]